MHHTQETPAKRHKFHHQSAKIIHICLFIMRNEQNAAFVRKSRLKDLTLQPFPTVIVVLAPGGRKPMSAAELVWPGAVDGKNNRNKGWENEKDTFVSSDWRRSRWLWRGRRSGWHSR
ncbi:hypothetical protein [Rhizobium sp. 18065]|uniref:hypothetical protein n=1 Tax=Rhizobium sp. 18065 TaxID=2681411 RepID=UPI001359EB22|nr:hypothetical protein [Rhizobium sp. 18065]